MPEEIKKYIDHIKLDNGETYWLEDAEALKAEGGVIDGDIEITGNLQVDTNLTVNNNTDLNGTVNIDGDTTVTGNTDITGDVSMSGSVEINGKTVLNDGADITGDVNTTGNIVSTGNLEIDGQTTLNDDVAVTGDVSTSGSSIVTGNSTFAGDVTVVGNVNVVEDTSLEGTLTVEDNTQLLSDLLVEGNSSIKGTTEITGKTTLKNGLDVIGNTTISGNESVSGDVIVTGDIKASNIAGGTEGQVLTKNSNTDFDFDWSTPVNSYDDLTNKPKINGVEVSGSHNGPWYGLQNTLSSGDNISIANNTVSFSGLERIEATSTLPYATVYKLYKQKAVLVESTEINGHYIYNEYVCIGREYFDDSPAEWSYLFLNSNYRGTSSAHILRTLTYASAQEFGTYTRAIYTKYIPYNTTLSSFANGILKTDSSGIATKAVAGSDYIAPNDNRLIPPLGNTGQILVKDSGANYDVSWQFNTYNNLIDQPQINGHTLTGNKTSEELDIHSIPSGGTAGQYLVKNTNTNYDTVWETLNTDSFMKKGVDYVTAGQQAGFTLGQYATAEGQSTVASGNSSHAEGGASTASGVSSHAEGENTQASGSSSHAEGLDTQASGNYGHAEGLRSIASGSSSHAEGLNTVASGQVSHAEGGDTTASGAGSHAEGRHTSVSGTGSHVEGYYTIAQRADQHVFGMYNVADTWGSSVSKHGTYVEIVGNGDSEQNRSNARTLDWSGNEVLAGKLTVGAGPTNNMDVATKQYVDDLVATSITNAIGGSY